MRIISKDRKYDVDYNNSLINIVDSTIQLQNETVLHFILGKYETEEFCKIVLEKLRDAYKLGVLVFEMPEELENE